MEPKGCWVGFKSLSKEGNGAFRALKGARKASQGLGKTSEDTFDGLNGPLRAQEGPGRA